MARCCLLLSCLFACIASVCAYDPNWASLDTRPTPTWYDDAKFGIFIHFGVYSVPAYAPVGTYAEWYWNDYVSCANNCATQLFHNKTYGPNYPYQNFAEHMTLELFNATQWAELFYNAGAKYVVPTSKHHEGWTWWNSAQSWNWNAINIKPGFDAIAELHKALTPYGIHKGVYFSIYEWFNPLYTGPDPTQYVDQVLTPQLYDVINTYQPDVLWTDGAWDHDSSFWGSTNFLAWLFNSSPVKDTVAIDDRWGSDTSGVHGGFYTAEYSSTVWLNHKWEENSGIDIHSFGLNRNTPASDYYTADYLILLLIRSVANNGNFLLDIGPRNDGTIPTIMQERLLQIGSWLKINGEAIYYSRPWRVQQEGTIDSTSLRYTTNPSTLNIYAITLTWPANGQLSIPSPIVSQNTVLTLLGGDGSALPYVVNKSGVGFTVTLPANTPANPIGSTAWVIKITNAK